MTKQDVIWLGFSRCAFEPQLHTVEVLELLGYVCWVEVLRMYSHPDTIMGRSYHLLGTHIMVS